MKRFTATLLLALVLLYQNSYAGGFQINEHGARAMGMGGAFTALSLDPSGLYFNSAAIARLKGTQFMLGTTLIAPSAGFRGPTPSVAESKMVSQVFTPSHLYATYRISEDWAVGFGLNNPFGLGTKWEENWVGRFSSIEGDLKTFSLNPVVAYNVNDWFSIGVGFLYNFASVKLTRAAAFAPFAGEAFVALEGDEKAAFGYTVGIQMKPSDKFSVGMSLRSKVKYEFEGTAVTTGAPSQLSASVPQGDITAAFTSPQSFAVGVAYMPTKDWVVSADWQFVGWSSYDSLKVNFANPALSDLASPREYQDTWLARLGCQYSYNKDLDIQAGVYFDRNPVLDGRVDPSLPDADRVGFSLGLGYKVTENLSVDASYLFIRFSERTITNSLIANRTGADYLNGTYNSSANLFSVSFSYGM